MEIKQTKTLVEGPFLKFCETEFVDNNGRESKWWWATRPTRAVMIIPIVRNPQARSKDTGGYEFNHRIVVTKEYRVPIQGYEWGFPAGLVDGKESIEATAERELKEETGLNLTKILEVTPFTYNSPGMSDESIAMVYCEAEGEISQDGNEGTEDITTYLMDKNDVLDLMKKDVMIGAKAYMVFRQFIKTGDIS